MELVSLLGIKVQRSFASYCFWITLLLLLQNGKGVTSASNFLIGLGSYDITGPAADVNMMGYANTDQIASGVHFRLRSRAFIVAEQQGNRVVFVNLDACMASQLVTIKVLERLKARYGDLYTAKNVAVSGIHTHAGPGGYLQYVVYIVTSLGFVRQSFDVIVNGIEQSIIQAHENLRPGSVFVNKGEILDAGVNRSPSAYLNNPAAERSKYKYDGDKEMTLLKFLDDEWGPIGSFNWFATHGTSMSRTNGLISGDNKGAAARFMEDWFDQNGAGSTNLNDSEVNEIPRRVSKIIPGVHQTHHELLELAASFQSSSGKPATRILSVANRVRSALRQADKPRFVSAFCQSNCGDVSPNVLGAFCTDTGLPCDFNQSTCGGKNELCYGRGPGYPDEFESTRIIGDRQFKKAVDLFNKASEQLKGKIIICSRMLRELLNLLKEGEVKCADILTLGFLSLLKLLGVLQQAGGQKSCFSQVECQRDVATDLLTTTGRGSFRGQLNGGFIQQMLYCLTMGEHQFKSEDCFYDLPYNTGY